MLVLHYTDIEPYRIWRTELVDPAGILTVLQQRRNDALRRVWESLDKNTRRRIEAFDPKRSDEAALAGTLSALRQDLNKLIEAKRPIFDDAVIAQVRPAEDGRTIVGTQSAGNDLKRVNRFLLEAAFPGQIQPFLREPSVLEEFSLILMPSQYWTVLLAAAVFVATFCLCSSRPSEYRSRMFATSIHSLNISSATSFRAPKIRCAVFRATWWNIFVYYVFRLEAIVMKSRRRDRSPAVDAPLAKTHPFAENQLESDQRPANLNARSGARSGRRGDRSRAGIPPAPDVKMMKNSSLSDSHLFILPSRRRSDRCISRKRYPGRASAPDAVD
jgi:hypothetical protein